MINDRNIESTLDGAELCTLLVLFRNSISDFAKFSEVDSIFLCFSRS